MPKQYTSVAELVQAIAPDADTRDTSERRIAGRKLVKHLMALRAVKEYSQQDIAKQLDCTQSRISKFEQSLDDDVRLGDFRAYAKAVGCEFVCGFSPPDMKPFDMVKCHVFAIKRHMDYLADLAKRDEKIAEAVAGFFTELFVNFARLFGDSVKKLPLTPNAAPYLDFQFSEMCQFIQEELDEPKSLAESNDRARHLASAST